MAISGRYFQASVIRERYVFGSLRRIHRAQCLSRRIVDPTEFADSIVGEISLDDFIAEQGKHPVSNEDRPRIAIPVHAGRPASIIVVTIARFQLAELVEIQAIVSKKEYGSGTLDQMTEPGLPSRAIGSPSVPESSPSGL